jgi:hypothetical protein
MASVERTTPPSQPCRLCSALEEEIEKTRSSGEAEREGILKFILRGHREAYHGAK